MAIEDEQIGAATTTDNFTAGTATFPTIDHNHPLYLQPTDTPGSPLISLQLTGSDNYALRSRAMRICLLGKSKLGFVDGRFPKSKFEPKLRDLWEKVNVIILSWIMNVVRPRLLSSVLYASSAHRVWEDLKERFDKVNGSRILYLHREVHTLTQGIMTVTGYFSTIESYGMSLMLSCLVLSRSQIMMMSPLPSINKAYSLLVDHQSQRNLTSITQVAQVTEPLENAALHSSRNVNNAGNYRPKRNHVQCEYCHYKGHTKDNCLKLTGYPTDFKAKRKGVSKVQHVNCAGNAEGEIHKRPLEVVLNDQTNTSTDRFTIETLLVAIKCIK
ncbi:PREDICTED: uncharacterized protein LOC109244035 [Nicotiana attenuata]|uniref:uncharacterized protein LOC109244035 n=1 Tax=Nicotiana attenuata TaxID=49451 RepID=UPI000905040C|nr:PREDICTED: uncharacterized protein LOC109244035 [Nicotiana attenuata]